MQIVLAHVLLSVVYSFLQVNIGSLISSSQFCVFFLSQQMSSLVTDHLSGEVGVDIRWKSVPLSVNKQTDDSLTVRWRDESCKEHEDQFDTVLFAIGESHNSVVLAG